MALCNANWYECKGRLDEEWIEFWLRNLPWRYCTVKLKYKADNQSGRMGPIRNWFCLWLQFSLTWLGQTSEDAQFWFRTVQDEYREDDGIHWTALAHRYLTNIFLTHISESWGIGWPTYPIPDKANPTSFDGVPWDTLRSSIVEYNEQTSYKPETKKQRY